MTRQKKKNSASKGQKSVAPKNVNPGPGPSTASSSPSTSRQNASARGNSSQAEQTENRSSSPSFEEQYVRLLLESEMITLDDMRPPPTFPDIPGFPVNPFVEPSPPRGYEVPLPEGASPLPEGFPLTQADLEIAYAHFAAVEDEDTLKYVEVSREYTQALRDAIECEPETDEDYQDMKEIWESLERVRKNLIPPVDIRGTRDRSQACSSRYATLLADVENGIRRHRKIPDFPSLLPIDPNEGRPVSQLPMDDEDSGEGPSTSGPSSSNAGPSTSDDGSPSYSPSSPLDGEGEQCAIEVRAATDDTDNGTNSFCPSPLNSSESEPEIRVVNEIRANPRTRAAHERLMRERRMRPSNGSSLRRIVPVPESSGSVSIHENVATVEPIDYTFGFEPSMGSQQPCSSSHGVNIDTSAIEFSFDPHWSAESKRADSPNPIDLSALARALEGLTDTAAIKEAYKNAYEKKLTDLTTENQLVTAENLKLKEKLVDLEKKLNERDGECSSTVAPTQPPTQPPAQPPQQSSNRNKKKNKKKGKK